MRKSGTEYRQVVLDIIKIQIENSTRAREHKMRCGWRKRRLKSWK